MISIVCVFNNRGILESYLLKSLENQTSNYELTMVDNAEGKFESASNALNWGAKEAKGKYIMFMHQDVDLCSNSWLEEVEKVLDQLPDLGIAWVAGKNERGALTKIRHGDPPYLPKGVIDFEKPTQVQTLDECLVIIPRSVFDILRFDEKVCDDWHLYAVDYSLALVRLGRRAYVIPAFIYHRSGVRNTGFLQIILSVCPYPAGYYQTLGKFLKKHGDIPCGFMQLPSAGVPHHTAFAKDCASAKRRVTTCVDKTAKSEAKNTCHNVPSLILNWNGLRDAVDGLAFPC